MAFNVMASWYYHPALLATEEWLYLSSLSYVTFSLNLNGDPNTTMMIYSGVIQEMANYTR